MLGQYAARSGGESAHQLQTKLVTDANHERVSSNYILMSLFNNIISAVK